MELSDYHLGQQLVSASVTTVESNFYSITKFELLYEQLSDRLTDSGSSLVFMGRLHDPGPKPATFKWPYLLRLYLTEGIINLENN